MSVEKIVADFETCKKARQWYIYNGYLNEKQFKAWQESSHERD